MEGVKRNIVGTCLFATYVFLAFVYVGWAFYWIYWDNLYYSSNDVGGGFYDNSYSVVTWDRYALAFATLLTASLALTCLIKPFPRKFRMAVCWILAAHSLICIIGIAYAFYYFHTADLFVGMVSGLGVVLSVGLGFQMNSKFSILLPFQSDKPEEESSRA